MEILLFGGIIVITILSIVVFCYVFPNILKAFASIPEWLAALIYSLICTYSVAVSYDFLESLLAIALLFIVGYSVTLSMSKIRSTKSILVRLFILFILTIVFAISSLFTMPIFWPVSLIMLLVYLSVLLSGWYVLSWLRSIGSKA